MQIKDLTKELERLKLSDSLPQQKKTPSPVRNKVVAKVDRAPVNRQSALVISPVKCWLSQPPHEPVPKNPVAEDLVKAINELKIQRNAHAITASKLGVTRAELRLCENRFCQLTEKCRSLEQRISEQTEEIDRLKKLLCLHIP